MVAGDLAVVPPGMAHWGKTISEDDAVMVVAYSVGGRKVEELP